MREWQVGDPVGDGNDIGVPDTKYMGYLKDKDSYREDTVDDFKFHINHAKDAYNMKNYQSAFHYLNSTHSIYNKMTDFEKSQLRDEPFNQDWIIDLCSKVINNHGRYYHEATAFILENKYPIKICLDCDCVYPIDYNRCIKCGKPVKRPIEFKSPEKIAEELSDELSTIIWDEFEKDRIVNRTLVLMKSNDSRLVKVRPRNYGFDFIFEKNHEYFKTRYICEYVSGSVRYFEDFTSEHSHENLLNNESFQKLIKETENKTGFTFKECSGGYGDQLDDNYFDFIFNDKIDVIVRFDMGDGRTAVYDIDLDNMKLSKEYRAY